MFAYRRIQRNQILRETEGYLDLAMIFMDRWPLSAPRRDQLAQRALDSLARIDSDRSCRAQILFLRGQALRVMERHREAAELLDRASELDPRNIRIWLALGWCYKRTGRLDLAIQSLEEALLVEEEQALIHYNLACYWSLAHNSKLAIGYLTRALDLDPTYRDLIPGESDFDPIRDDPGFRNLTSVIV